MKAVFLVLIAVLVPGVLSADQEVFRVWHYETSALAASWNLALDRFQAAHPDVRVELTVKSFDEVRSTGERILSSDQGPDVLEFNKGDAHAGYFAARGAFRDLSTEVVRRGWDKVLPLGIQTTSRYDSRGRMGSGSWYGVPSYGEFVLVYYNKALFRKAGVAVPRTLAEFEAGLAALKRASLVPLSLSAASYPAQHLLYELYLGRATRAEVEDFQRARAPVTLTSPAWKGAAETLFRWGSAGYFSPSASTLGDEGMFEEFRSGKAAMMVGGSWFFPRLLSTRGDWGTFLFPGNRMHPGSGGNLWVVPSRSRHPEWALEFMGYTLDRSIQTALANGGGLALAADADRVTNPQAAELNRLFAQVLTQDGLALYPDWPALGFYDSLVEACRDLLKGVPVSRVLDGLELAYRTKKGSP